MFPSPAPSSARATALFLLLCASARPASAVDTTHSLPGPAAGDASDAPTAASPFAATTDEWVATGRLEYARRTFWGITRIPDCTGANCATEGALLEGVVFAHLGAQKGVGRRLTLGAATQLQGTAWAGSDSAIDQGLDKLGSPRFMDLHAWGRYTLLEGPRTAVAVVPWVTLDGSLLGDEAAPTGHAVVGAGSSVAGRLVWGLRSQEVTAAAVPQWTVTADGGLRATLGLDAAGPPGTNQRLALDGTVAGSWALAPQGAVVGEVALQSLEADGYVKLGAELRSGVRWRVGDRLEALGLVGFAPTRAPGDAHPRLVAGVRYLPAAPAFGHPVEAVAGGVGVRAVGLDGWRLEATAALPSGAPLPAGPGHAGETRIALPDGQETVVVRAAGTVGRHVLPRSRPPLRPVVLPPATGNGVLMLRVVDLDGLPMPRARVRMDGVDLGFVESDGTLRLDGLAEGVQALELSAPDFEPRTLRVPVLPLTPDVAAERIQLKPPLGQVQIEVRGAGGPLPKATVQVLSAVAAPKRLSLDKDGTLTTILLPGKSIVRVEAPGFGAQELVVDVDPERVRSERLRFRLLPKAKDGGALELNVVDTDGAAVEGAEVRVGGETVGRTASGGVLRVEDVEAGQSTVEVEAENFRSYEEVTVDVQSTATAEVVAPMRWEAGAVRIVVVGPEGPVPDTTVRFQGPNSLEPARVRGDGFLDLTLPVGEWTAVVDAPGHATQERTFVVQPDDDQRQRVDVGLLAERDTPTGTLSLRLEDQEGLRLAGVRVTADGAVLGTSTAGGELVATGLPVGDVELVVEGPTTEVLRAVVSVAAEEATAQTLQLTTRPGLVSLVAVSGGQPLDAFVRLIGPKDTPPVRLGEDGERSLALRPGTWEIVFTHEAHLLEIRDVEVSAEDPAPIEVVWEAVPSDQQAILGLERVPLVVRTVSAADETPLPSQVRLLGPTVVPVMDTDSAGELTVQVTPGAWEVLASTPTSGIAGVDAEVDAETEPDPVVVKLGDARVSVGDLAVALSETVQFETGSSRLLPLSWGLLDEVARTLRATPQLVELAVEGHTDSTGSDEVNRVLSLERAEAVRAYLIARGVAPSRLRAEGYGSSVPVASNDTEAGRETNRRVAFRIVDQSLAEALAAADPE